MDLGRRERQIMAFIYRQNQATAAEVMEGIEDPPSYSGVRAMLRILEEKGHLHHRRQRGRYIYVPTLSPAEAGRSAMNYLVQMFFSGSAKQAVASLLDLKRADLTESDFDHLSGLIEQARKQGQ